MASRLVAEAVAPSGWDAWLKAAGGSLFHCTVWAEYVASAVRGCVPFFLRLMGEGEAPRAMALAFHARSSRRWLAPFTGRLWLDSQPVAASAGDTDSVRALLLEMESWARATGVVEVSVGSYASPDSTGVLQTLGYRTQKRLEFEFDLRRSDAELLQSMAESRRRRLGQARRGGVNVMDLDPEIGLREMRRLEAVTSERIAQQGGPRFGYTGDPDRDPARILLEHGFGRLVGALVDGRLVSVGIFTHFGSLVHNTHGGHDQRALETNASTLMLWEMLRQYRDLGAQRFSLGGCASGAAEPGTAEHGIYLYKKAFGATCLSCTSGTRLLRPLTYRAITRMRQLANMRN